MTLCARNWKKLGNPVVLSSKEKRNKVSFATLVILLDLSLFFFRTYASTCRGFDSGRIVHLEIFLKLSSFERSKASFRQFHQGWIPFAGKH